MENVGYIRGNHSGFLKHIQSIVDFLIPPDGKGAIVKNEGRGPWLLLKWVSDWGCWAFWLLLVFIVGWIGFRVAGAAREHVMLVAAVYIAIVLWILKTL